MISKAVRVVGHVILLVISLIAVVWLIPERWLNDDLRIQLSQWFGAPGLSNSVASMTASGAAESASQQVDNIDAFNAELVCPPDLQGWRNAQQIDGVQITASEACVPDNPYAVAAFVRGSNNVSQGTLLQSGLTPDAVEKSDDLDGDGDPDVIHIRLEVAELNGASPDNREPVTQFAIAPGVNPALWVFAPKSFGMATVNFESSVAKELLRAPSPSIRIEQGDIVKITLENSHYMPHTLHFHGVDHAFQDETGEGNDGVPITSEFPVKPGSARTYELEARHAGTMFYHCHVQVQVHVMMGLQGMFVVEENKPDNWLQTLNIGAGHVRVPSRGVSQTYQHEYDLVYTDLDMQLNQLVQASNDANEIERSVNRDYDITDADSDYFLLNGKSFPYTFQESLVITQPDELTKLRIVNGGSVGLSLHTHGHKTTATHYDGVAVNPGTEITRDVFWLSSAQRVDLELNSRNDGLHSYGEGVWLLHDHQERAVTNNGLGPGGNLAAIVYRSFLGDNGWPQTSGENLQQYFSPDYYRRGPVPTEEFNISSGFILRMSGLGIFLGILIISIGSLIKLVVRPSP